MSYAPDYAPSDLFAIDAAADARGTFMRKTYMHLFGAILAFVAFDAVIFSVPSLKLQILGLFGNRVGLMLMIVAFMAAGWVAQSWAHNASSRGLQYAGLGLYTLVQAIIFVPILWVASNFAPGAIETAGFLTLAIFGGLTAIVFVTGANFSFLRTALMIGIWSALAVSFAGVLFGFQLGLLFSGAMVVLAGGYILYDTSNVLHNYRTDQYVGAALELFASVALLFFYVLRIVIALQSRD